MHAIVARSARRGAVRMHSAIHPVLIARLAGDPVDWSLLPLGTPGQTPKNNVKAMPMLSHALILGSRIAYGLRYLPRPPSGRCPQKSATTPISWASGGAPEAGLLVGPLCPAAH